MEDHPAMPKTPPARPASPPLDWSRLSLTEEGGFAALRRGVSLSAGDLPDALARRIGAWLAKLAEELGGQPPAAYPDAMRIGISFEAGGRQWQWRLDAADLPEAAADLLDELRPLFKPLPPP